MAPEFQALLSGLSWNSPNFLLGIKKVHPSIHPFVLWSIHLSLNPDNTPVSAAEDHHHSVMLPPLCFIVGIKLTRWLGIQAKDLVYETIESCFSWLVDAFWQTPSLSGQLVLNDGSYCILQDNLQVCTSDLWTIHIISWLVSCSVWHYIVHVYLFKPFTFCRTLPFLKSIFPSVFLLLSNLTIWHSV